MLTVNTEMMPKLLPEDRRLFLSYASDLFPGVEGPSEDHEDLAQAITQAFIDSNLVVCLKIDEIFIYLF